MNEKETTKISKKLSYVLRHAPESIGIELEKNGWTSVKILLEKLNLSFSDLNYVVANNSKKRFAFSEDKTKIRANQGHSISIDLGLTKTPPPDILYHGTATRNLESIKNNGISKQKRHQVHLSNEIETAKQVGSRYGKPIVLKINTRKMADEGIVFFRTENGVWLTDYVAPEYLIFE